MGPAFFPVVGVAFGKRPDTRFPGFQYIPTGADTLFKFRACSACRAHGYMVIAKISRKIGAAPVKRNNHFVFSVGLYVYDGFQVSFGTGFGILAPVEVDGKDHVLGCHGFAIVKFHALAQFECPHLGIGC